MEARTVQGWPAPGPGRLLHEVGLTGGSGRKRTKSRHRNDLPLALTTEPWRLSGGAADALRVH